MNPKLEELRDRYALAERLSKQVAHFTREAIIPAQNELRNAGYHLLKALDANGQANADDQLDKAIDHCDRAIYDAAEAGLVVVIDRLNDYFRQYESVSMHEVIPNIATIRGWVSDGVEMITDGREGDGIDSLEFSSLFRHLIDAVHTIEHHLHELNQLLKKERRAARLFYLAVLACAAGIANVLFRVIG